MPEDELAYARLLSTRYTRLVFLGDSNADNGNVLRLTNGAHPQPSSLYWQGRYSDGKVWADYLAEAASPAVAINLAYGCATIDNEIVSGTVAMADGRRVEVPSVADQTGELEQRIGRLNPTDLVLIQVGSNDLNSLIDSGPYYCRKREFTPLQLAERLCQIIKHLCTQLGARNVLVMNVRPREDYPGVIALGPELRELTRQATALFNATVGNGVAALQTALGTEVCLRLFDTYSVQKQIGLVAGAADSERVPDPTLFIDGCHLGTRAQAEIYWHVLEAIARDMI
ncbi:hypothetical protein H4S02_000688 [Coemansia sp. RSA 2611]|nr:hypothetical protein H4S02_000688 [Coemansia sp. RSA 2611]